MNIYANTLGEISYWLFKEREKTLKKFRILVTGVGTGYSTVFLAEKLKN